MKWTKIGLYISIAFTGILVLGFLGETVGFWDSGSSGSSGNDKVYLLCVNPKCPKPEIEMTINEYTEMIQNTSGDMAMEGMMMGPQALKCPNCGKKSAYMAIKCPKCGKIFIMDYRTSSNYPDRCPKCHFSQMEDAQKKLN